MAFVYPEQGNSEIRFDATGALFGRTNTIPEIEIVSAGGVGLPGVFAYTSGVGLYGINNVNSVGNNAIQIGENASAPLNAIRIGSNATTQPIGSATVGIGTNSGAYAGVGSIYSVLIGYDALTNNDISSSITIGANSRCYASNSIALGAGAEIGTGDTNSVAIGTGVVSTATNQFNIGVSSSSQITFDTWTPNASVATASTHEIPILVNGVRYNLLASNV